MPPIQPIQPMSNGSPGSRACRNGAGCGNGMISTSSPILLRLSLTICAWATPIGFAAVYSTALPLRVCPFASCFAFFRSSP